MNIWRFGPLESRVDVRNRFLLRFMWCSVGLALCIPFLKHFKRDIWAIAGVVIIIPVIGIACDAYSLKHPQVSLDRLRLVAIAIVTLMLTAYAAFRFLAIN